MTAIMDEVYSGGPDRDRAAAELVGYIHREVARQFSTEHERQLVYVEVAAQLMRSAIIGARVESIKGIIESRR